MLPVFLFALFIDCFSLVLLPAKNVEKYCRVCFVEHSITPTIYRDCTFWHASNGNVFRLRKGRLWENRKMFANIFNRRDVGIFVFLNNYSPNWNYLFESDNETLPPDEVYSNWKKKNPEKSLPREEYFLKFRNYFTVQSSCSLGAKFLRNVGCCQAVFQFFRLACNPLLSVK